MDKKTLEKTLKRKMKTMDKELKSLKNSINKEYLSPAAKKTKKTISHVKNDVKKRNNSLSLSDKVIVGSVIGISVVALAIATKAAMRTCPCKGNKFCDQKASVQERSCPDVKCRGCEKNPDGYLARKNNQTENSIRVENLGRKRRVI